MMKVGILLALLLAVAVSRQTYAVLVAGSNGYYNYRHQADVFHAYQVLTDRGIPHENIITMAYDDIPTDQRNPFPGKVYNKPTYSEPGVDVYNGVQIDYKGADVTPANFLAVLRGDKEAAGGKKVLEAGKNDNVFVFFSDHGAPGIMAFPRGSLHVGDLQTCFEDIEGKYNKFVFYLEVVFS